MKVPFLIALIAAFSVNVAESFAQSNELKALKASVDTQMQKTPFNYAAYSAAIEEAREAVYGMIRSDKLVTSEDFFLASILADDPTGFYESRRVQHELALTALVLGHPEGVSRVKITLDALYLSIGRGQRFESFKSFSGSLNMDTVRSPEVVRNVFMKPPEAQVRAASRKDNEELEHIRQADQTDRKDTITPEMQQRMAKDDPLRRARVMEMISAGSLATGRDFHNAALVLQHGQGFEDFRLAHELAIAAVALGDKNAVWLISRTYDRMLLTLGHRQRLQTQFGGPRQALLPFDSTAVNDRIRKLLGADK